MKKLLLAVTAASAALLAGCATTKSATGSSPGAFAAAPALDSSGYALFEKIRGQAKVADNTFISPVSVQQALGLVHAGARGETALQIEKAWGLPAGAAADQALAAQRGAIVGKAGDSEVKLANALWLAKQFNFKSDYLKRTETDYAATAQRLDFAGQPKAAAATINSWANKSTNGLISEVADPSSFSAATVSVLSNAIFFEGKWAEKFDAAVPDPFLFGDGSEKPFPMMNKLDRVAYAEADGWKAVRLPYASDNRFAMDLFIPVKRQSGAMLSAATYRSLTAKLAAADPVPVRLAVPRFEIDWKQQINDALIALGIANAFDPQRADLLGIAEPAGGNLVISKVSHASKLQVFETGTRAAAVTTVDIVVTGGVVIKPEPKVFRADQPFHLSIRELRSGTPLFLGRIASPKVYAGS